MSNKSRISYLSADDFWSLIKESIENCKGEEDQLEYLRNLLNSSG